MRWHRNVWVVTATSLLTDISSEMIVHLLPLFLRSVLGAPVALIGLLDGIAETVSAVVKIIAGRASDRFRSRKWFAVAGYAVSAAAKPFLLLTQTWFGVLGVRFADRVGKGLRNPPRDALLAASSLPTSTTPVFYPYRITGSICWCSICPAASVTVTE